MSVVSWLRNLFDTCPWEDVALWESLHYSWAFFLLRSGLSLYLPCLMFRAYQNSSSRLQRTGTRFSSIALTDPSLREMQFLRPQPDSLNQIWEWGPAICILTNPPHDSNEAKMWETLGQKESGWCRVEEAVTATTESVRYWHSEQRSYKGTSLQVTFLLNTLITSVLS